MRNTILVLVMGLALVGASTAVAQEKKGDDMKMGKMEMQGKDHHEEGAMGHSHEACEIHGGSVTMTPHHHFETLFTPEDIRIYAYTEDQAPINELKDAKVSLTLEKKDGKPEMLSMKYMAPDMKAGRSQGYFEARHDLSKMEQGMMKATFTITGMGKEPVTFKTPVVLSHPVVYSCPMHPEATAMDPVPCPKCGMAMVKTGGSMDEDHDEHEHGHEDHEGHNH